MLGAGSALDAGRLSALAWVGTGVAVALLAGAVMTASAGPVGPCVALLAAVFLARHSERALLAPLYATGLLIVAELAHWSIDERVPMRVAADALAPRLTAILLLAAGGLCASFVVTLASQASVGRSPALTAVGAAAVVVAFALLARARA